MDAALHDRYRIDRELVYGGMATVYLAHDLRHESAGAPASTAGGGSQARAGLCGG